MTASGCERVGGFGGACWVGGRIVRLRGWANLSNVMAEWGARGV